MKLDRRHSIATVEKEIGRQENCRARIDTAYKKVYLHDSSLNAYIFYFTYQNWTDLLTKINEKED